MSSKSFKMDLNIKEGQYGYDVLHKSANPVGMKEVVHLEKQSSTSGGASTMTQQQHAALAAKKKSKAMALATKPGQQILMNGFMMYMSGKNLNIFSITISSTAILSPLRGIFTMDKMFGQLEGVDLQLPKLVFIGLNLVWFIFGIYKLSSMRLLPTTSADWTGSIVWKEMMETTAIPPEPWMA